MSQIEHLPSLEAREEPGWKRYLGDSILAIVGTLIILKIVDVTIGVRVTKEQEMEGLDTSMHNEEGYIFEA